jgi:outer membrane protein assembly factor BamD (BamD/ComL family)
MSVAGISSASYSSYNSQSNQGPFQDYWPEFKQLDKDLQAGNLSAAQTDFANLLKNAPQLASNASSQTGSPIAQAFKQLEQDLQAGNLSAAQQDFATIKQDFKSLNTQQSQASQDSESVEGHSHHHLGGDESDSSFSSLFSQLGKELQSGDLSSAQQTFSTLEQDFSSNSQQSGQTASDQASTSSVSVNV